MSALGYGIAAVTAGLWAWKERRELMAGLPSDEALRAAATFSSRFAISPLPLFCSVLLPTPPTSTRTDDQGGRILELVGHIQLQCCGYHCNLLFR